MAQTGTSDRAPSPAARADLFRLHRTRRLRTSRIYRRARAGHRFRRKVDFVAISCMLTCQIKPGWESPIFIAKRGFPFFRRHRNDAARQETKDHATLSFSERAEGTLRAGSAGLAEKKTQKSLRLPVEFPRHERSGSGPPQYPRQRSLRLPARVRIRWTSFTPHADAGIILSCCCTPFLADRHSGPGPSMTSCMRWSRSRTPGCSSWTIRWRRTTDGKRICSGR